MGEKIKDLTSISPKSTTIDDNLFIYLYEEVTTESINRVLGEIYDNTDKNIVLRVKTYGGKVLDALALVDIIQQYNIAVHIDGYGCSAGLLILCSANVRSMGDHAELMYHEMQTGSHGSVTDMRRDIELDNKLNKRLKSILTRDTKLTAKQLEKIDETTREWWLDKETAKQYNIINHEFRLTSQDRTTVEATRTLGWSSLDKKEEDKPKQKNENKG